jgi:DnaK suppressor protein
MMTKTEMNMFQGVLQNRETQLGNGKRKREALAIDTGADELDRIQQASVRDSVIGDLERNSGWLREVRTALRRITSREFGICVACEEDISPKRLAAVPWAARCIGCQEALEREKFETDLDRSLLAA